MVTAIAVLALGAPLAATAAPGNGKATGPSPSNRSGNYVSPDLQAKAKNDPNDLAKVIIQSSYGTADARNKARGMGQLVKLGRNLDLVNGVSAELPAKLIDKLGKLPGLSITPDVPVKFDSLTTTPSYSSNQLWPYANGNAFFWNQSATPATIAVVDSGIDANRADFSNGARVLASVNLSTLDPTPSIPDDRGHGTFVAGIAAGSATGYAGAAPKANLVSIKVMDANGEAYTSDVIAACNWIVQNKATYNIKVANFSLHSTYPSNFGHDPLDAAVEKLWFDGVTVVAAAGNYGNSDGTPSGVHYAPGNDPFVITVGAVDLGTSPFRSDDSVAWWSAYGHTYDGFWKPDISADGRYMVGPVPPSSTLVSERPDKVTAPGYMQLSGTSFSTPVVAGTAAQLLGLHPTWGPDQVKGALMHSALPIPMAQPFQGGVGELNAVLANMVTNPPNPNKALEQYVVPDPAGGSVPVFDAVSWYDAATSDVSWDSVSWSDVSWSDVSWSDVSWSDVSWDSVSWADVSWSDVSWADVSWADSATEDAVAGDGTPADVVPIDSSAAADLQSDPDLTGDPTADYSVLDALTGTTDTTATSTVDSTTTATTGTTTSVLTTP
ncbi:MAG TPA: S8 family serine peptidase [Gaiellaceae bacterium]|nr:S8 family serine peptidase [Gaiellaceae bacterium]